MSKLSTSAIFLICKTRKSCKACNRCKHVRHVRNLRRVKHARREEYMTNNAFKTCKIYNTCKACAKSKIRRCAAFGYSIKIGYRAIASLMGITFIENVCVEIVRKYWKPGLSPWAIGCEPHTAHQKKKKNRHRWTNYNTHNRPPINKHITGMFRTSFVHLYICVCM